MPNSADLVESFWERVWNAHDPQAVDDFVTEDFVITTGGVRVEGRENFKVWIQAFLDQVRDLRLEVAETFENADGSRVASRWHVHGFNNGVLGTEPDGHPISFSGTAVWEIADGKLVHNHVERSSWELYQRIRAA